MSAWRLRRKLSNGPECGLAAAVAEASGFPELFRYSCGYAAPEAEPQTIKPQSRKPEAFRKGSG